MRQRRGFSLMELILALALAVIVMSLIVTSIRLYLIQLEKRRVEIEQQHISRGVIRMIDEDLRSAIQYKATDYTPLEDLIASQSLAGIGNLPTGDEDIDPDSLEDQIINAVESGGGGTGTQNTATAPGNQGQGEQTEEESEEGEEDEEEETGRPTFVGTSQFIRLDISRLPRLDEYNPLIVQRSTDQQLPSDIKTITYFFSDSRPVDQFAFDEDFGKNGGLYRRQVDRAVEAFRNGDQDIEIVLQPDEYCELISPEISELGFRFWDGQNWFSEWDSEQMMGFPIAVEIAIVIDPERVSTDAELDELNELEIEIKRSVVHLPVAEIIEEEEETGDSGEQQ